MRIRKPSRMLQILKTPVILLCSLVFVGASLFIYTHVQTPVRHTVNLSDLNQYPNSILVRQTWHTGTQWEQLGDANSFFDKKQIDDVQLIGNRPPIVSFFGNANIYLCIVNYMGDYKLEGSISKFREYKVID